MRTLHVTLRVLGNQSSGSGSQHRSHSGPGMRADTVRQCTACGFFSFTLQQCEKRKNGRDPISLTIPGCVYIKSTLAVSGDGKLWVFTDTRGYRRGDRLADDLCLEISQTSCCTSLQLAHSVMTIRIHSQMFKAPFPLSLSFLEGCGAHRASVRLK